MPHALRRTCATSLAALLMTIAGCTDDGGSDGATEDEPDLDARLANAKSQIDEAPSIDFTIATESLPSGVTGLVEAEGTGTNAPAFDGTAQVSANGGVTAEVVSVAGDVYVKTDFTPDFIALDPAQLGAPDPAVFFDTEVGVSSLLVATEDLAEGEAERDGEEVLDTITGTLPGERLQVLLPTADAAGDFDVTYRLADDDVLRGALITGPFYADSPDVTYDVVVDPSAESVEITAP